VARRAFLLHPLLTAAVPAMSIAAGNPGQYRGTDLLTVLAVVVAGVALVLVVAVLALGRSGRSPRGEQFAAVFVTLGVFWFFFYLPIYHGLRDFGWLTPVSDALPVIVLVSVAAAAALWLRPAALSATGRFLTVTTAILVAMNGARLAAQHVGTSRAVAHSRLVQSLAAPIHTRRVPAGRNDPKRDIYLVVLDTRANGAVLREFFGVDDSTFEDSLRALGFVIPARMEGNYMQTFLSLTSLLNFHHITLLGEDAGRESKDFGLPKYLIAHNRAARFLKTQGYRYAFFPSSWFHLTERSPIADEEFELRSGIDLRGELTRTEFRRWVIVSSLLRKLGSLELQNFTDTALYFRTFNGIKRLRDDPAPTFAFAHLLFPHGPFLVGADCRPRAHPLFLMAESKKPEVRAAYVDQLRCSNRLVLDLVTTLLRDSPTPPIILIVGDHGTTTMNAGYWAQPERASAAFTRERFGAFGAFYLPAGGDSLFAGRVTLVNVLGHVLRYYFGADVPVAPDDQFVSGTRPYRFYRRDQVGLATGGTASHGGYPTAAP
jgi:hypothetical protein